MEQKNIDKIGWIASLMASAMYLSYIDQIRLNVAGQKGSFLLPIISVINCAAWIIYGAAKERKDWPIIICNILGAVITAVTAATALI